MSLLLNYLPHNGFTCTRIANSLVSVKEPKMISIFPEYANMSSSLPHRSGHVGRLCVRCGRLGGPLSSGHSGVLQPSHQQLAVHGVGQDGGHKPCCGGTRRPSLRHGYSCSALHTNRPRPTPSSFKAEIQISYLLKNAVGGL